MKREPNDMLLANSVPEGLIDIILGGHDHYVPPRFGPELIEVPP